MPGGVILWGSFVVVDEEVMEFVEYIVVDFIDIVGLMNFVLGWTVEV